MNTEITNFVGGQRLCPRCGKTINYKLKSEAIRSEKLGKLCGVCAKIKRFEDPREREKISLSTRGEKSHMWGKHVSPEVIEKISKGNIGRKHTYETKRKMSQPRLGNNKDRMTIELICECCGRKFMASASSFRHNRRFCNYSCSSIMKVKKMKTSGTSIENAVEKYFQDNKIQYEKQVSLNGVALVDFLVGTTVVQCDGIYWHSLPNREKHDDEQDKKLNDLGYTVIRLSDKEINGEDLRRTILRKTIIATMHNQNRVSWRSGQ